MIQKKTVFSWVSGLYDAKMIVCYMNNQSAVSHYVSQINYALHRPSTNVNTNFSCIIYWISRFRWKAGSESWSTFGSILVGFSPGNTVFLIARWGQRTAQLCAAMSIWTERKAKKAYKIKEGERNWKKREKGKGKRITFWGMELVLTMIVAKPHMNKPAAT